jgi:hypothetical protein
MSKTLHWQKAVPAHHHALRDQYHAPADSTQNIGSCSPAHGLANNMAFAASFNFVSTHTAPTFPYILVCSAVILEHFRWRTFRDFTIALCYWHCTTRACSITFSAYAIPFGIHHSYWRLISWCPEHSGINKKALPVSLSHHRRQKPPSEKSLRPRKAPVLYGVILQAIVLKCTISNTWLVRLTRRSRVFRLV